MAKKPQLKITQVRSRIGYKPKAKRTLDALGLRKLNKTVIMTDTPAIRGMINKIAYLLRVEDV
ncbi:MAG: 50S ribosomal protein L30 [Candidatus Marinimicrobia bacterium]|jgi:large subunit ribosomal protein L30|nr:50S ribosomal protein L30 [Candidatus Neomarinimicrobiota bacterium]MBT3617216.1 50S ribosomal protein L30 [Candidatus Neomarinimicrobiota bacterium]MBT3829747.1 50S ribosomal protein L30 [Candidatus Neomarinimicrobiota bacterium]MBT3997906.1 50S ribosomal protein L30 [Candidatus Neomarinimicrobiota bacterium]MBT4281284.1 50S ribosomal protein L30 [Candidatus Neomarinimicrobiota bacterium]